MCVGVGTMIICGVQRTYLCRHEYHGHVWSSEDKLVSTFSGLSFFEVLFLKVYVCVYVHVPGFRSHREGVESVGEGVRHLRNKPIRAISILQRA